MGYKFYNFAEWFMSYTNHWNNVLIYWLMYPYILISGWGSEEWSYFVAFICFALAGAVNIYRRKNRLEDFQRIFNDFRRLSLYFRPELNSIRNDILELLTEINKTNDFIIDFNNGEMCFGYSQYDFLHQEERDIIKNRKYIHVKVNNRVLGPGSAKMRTHRHNTFDEFFFQIKDYDEVKFILEEKVLLNV